MTVRSFCAPAARVLPVTLAVLAAFPLTPAAAQTTPAAATPTLPETVVTANRIQQPLSEVLGDMTIIDGPAIERSAAVTLAEVLVNQPGVEITRNGGPGTTTNLYLRGAPTENTLVFINGVRVGVQSGSGGAPWEALPASQIERVEILRGAAASVYGSSASAGVIQIFTKQGEAGQTFKPYVGLGLGNRGRAKVEAGVSGAHQAFDYALGVSHDRSNGFNAKPGNAKANPDDDGFRNSAASARLGLQINPQHRVDASLLYSNMNAQFDDQFPPANDDRSRNRLLTAGLAWQGQWTPNYKTTLSASTSQSTSENSPNPYYTRTNLGNVLWQNQFKLGAHSTFTANFEHKSDALDNRPAAPQPQINRSRHQNAVALGYGLVTGGHRLQLSLRHDRDSEFGGQTTGGIGYGYQFAPGWTASIGYNTSFRAPSLYQRFSEYGQAGLKPETSKNLELALRYERGASRLGVVAYRNTFDNLIGFGGPGPCVSTFGCYANTAQARLSGVTFSGQHRFDGVMDGSLTLRASVDLQSPRDLVSGKILPRRAQKHGSLGAEYRRDGWTFSADVLAAGSRRDSDFNTTILPSYVTVNLALSKRFARDWQLIGRIDNATNKNYQLASGYATPPRQFYLGVKWAPL